MTKLAISRGDSNLDKIRAFYANPAKFALTPAMEAVRLRLAEVLTLKLNYWNNQRIVKKWQTDYNLSSAQAYLDIKHSELLFGEVLKTDREAKQAMLYEFAFKALQRAREKGDLKSELKALDLMGKYSGVEDDQLEFNPEKLGNVNIALAIPKKVQELFMSMMNQGVVNLNDFDATTIDYEELKEEDDDKTEKEG